MNTEISEHAKQAAIDTRHSGDRFYQQAIQHGINLAVQSKDKRIAELEAACLRNAKHDGWEYCPWCGKSLSGSEKPREEAEWRVKHERLKFLEDSFELCDCRAEDQFVCPRCEEIKALENEFDSIRPERPLPTQPEE